MHRLHTTPLLRECKIFPSELGLTFNVSKTQLNYFRSFKARFFKLVVCLSLSSTQFLRQRQSFGAHSALHSWWHHQCCSGYLWYVQKGKPLATCFHWLRFCTQTISWLYMSHCLSLSCGTGSLHCVANIYNKVSRKFSNFLTHALKSDSPHIQTIYQWSSNHAFTAPGFNNLYISRTLSKSMPLMTEFVQSTFRTFNWADLPLIPQTVLNSACCDWIHYWMYMPVSCITYLILILLYTFL